jgi:hypothetical protein
MTDAITRDLYERLQMSSPRPVGEFTHAEVLAQALVMVAEERERADLYEGLFMDAYRRPALRVAA